MEKMLKETKLSYRKLPVPYTGKRSMYHFRYRFVRTIQECRNSCDKEVKQYVRAKRNYAKLHTVWDDRDRHFEKSWKKQYIIKKQWMKHLI